MNKLDFGQFNGGSTFGFNSELKSKMEMKKGNATIDKVDIHEKETPEAQLENGEEPSKWRNITMRFKGVEGGGCFDTISSRTPSKFILGLQRVKYLFNAAGVAMPDVPFLTYGVNGSEDAVTKQVLAGLNAYAESGAPVSDVASVNGDNQIIINSLTAFNSIYGTDTELKYVYANLSAVADLKFKHEANLASIGTGDINEPARAEAKQAYYASLDAQPVVPCSINDASIDALAECIGGITAVVEIETKSRNRKQVKSYTKIS